MSKMKKHLLICLFIIFSGCDGGPQPYQLGPQEVEVTPNGDLYNLQMSVVLSGGHPNDIRIEGVEVRFIENETIVSTYPLGTFSVDNATRKFNTTFQNQPDKILIVYDRVRNEGGSQRNVFGYIHINGEYEPYYNYSSNY